MSRAVAEHSQPPTLRRPARLRMAIAMIAAACAALGAVATALGAPPKGGAANIAMIGEPQTLDPMSSTADLVGTIMQHVYELLYTYDANSNIVPMLAESMPTVSNGGLVYTGLWPGRPRDTAALGVVYGQFSNQLQRSQRDQQKQGIGSGPQRYELALELTYAFQVARWLQFQPDLQYVINPGGTGKIRDALVIGFQLAVNL